MQHNTNNIGGTEAYVRSLACMAAQARPEGRAAQLKFRRSVIKGHGKRWKLLDAGRRDAFRRDAELLREERREENKKTVSNLSLKLRGLQDKLAEKHENTAGLSRISQMHVVCGCED